MSKELAFTVEVELDDLHEAAFEDIVEQFEDEEQCTERLGEDISTILEENDVVDNVIYQTRQNI